jgi:ABC-type sugar transport system substrate-binding protein
MLRDNTSASLRRLAGVVAVAGALVAMAGCSSSSDTSGSGGAATDISKFQKVADDASKPWTTWEGPTSTPTPPKNIKLAVVPCAGAIAGCTIPTEQAAKAAKSLGWSVTSYDGQGDPVKQNQVVTQAINSGADAVLLAGIDPSQISSALKLAAQKKVPVGSMTQGIKPGNGIAFDVGGDYARSGVIEGSWIVADSKGKAVVLPTNDKEFASTVAIVDAAIKTVKECSGCSVKKTEYFVGSNIGNGLGQRIASALQRQPDVNYVIGAFDPAVADMVPAIKNAGIGNRVKIVSDVGLAQNVQFIKDGNVQAADVVYDNEYTGYAAVDQMIRVLTGNDLWKSPGVTDERFLYSENVPQHLITKDNVGDPQKQWVSDVKTVEHYGKLWGVTK